MRFIIKLMIGLILFNAMIVIFSGFMPHPTIQNNAVNVTEEYGGYKTINIGNTIKNILLTPDNAGIFITLLGVGALAGIFSGMNIALYLGISIVLGILLTVLNGTLKVFIFLDNYPVVSALFSVMLIIIGIIAILSVGDTLMSRSDMN